MLTDNTIKNAKPKEKFYRLADSAGMYLEITPNGGKWWRLKYRMNGKEKRLSLGTYPTISLKEAREKRDDARKLLASGIDPSENRKAIKATRISEHINIFEVIAREWHSKNTPTWAPTHSSKVISRLERDIFPYLGSRPITSIKAKELLEVIRKIEERDAIDSARRTLLHCGQVFRFAIATGRAEHDITPALRGALQPAKASHLAAITDPEAFGELLRAIEDYKGNFVTKCALKLAPKLLTRPGELRKLEWSEVNLDAAEINIRADRMKMKTNNSHLVPLSTQSVTILRELHQHTGCEKYVFPSELSSTRPMSENTLLYALRRMGFGKDTTTIHGFRATARTLLDEVLGFRPDFIEHQLAHAVRDPNGRAYNRTTYLKERRQMMQQWSDYIDQLKSQQQGSRDAKANFLN